MTDLVEEVLWSRAHASKELNMENIMTLVEAS